MNQKEDEEKKKKKKKKIVALYSLQIITSAVFFYEIVTSDSQGLAGTGL